VSEEPEHLAPDAALSWLQGARVERLDGPLPGLFAITLYSPGKKQCLLLALSAGQRGVGVSDVRPKGEAASSFVQRLRGKLHNARLLQARWLGGEGARATALMLTFARGEEKEQLVADFDARFPALVLLNAQGLAIGASDEAALRKRLPNRRQPYQEPQGRGIPRVLDESSARALGHSLLTSNQDRGEELIRARARAQVRAALKRTQRKAEAIRGDVARAETAPRLRREASLLLCHLHELARGLSEVTLRDESIDPPDELRITLDPAKDARLNADHKFERAKKLDRGAIIARSRLHETEVELERLTTLLAAIEGDDPDAFASAARELGLPITRPQATSKKREPQTHSAYRTFVGSGNRRILVGKGAADNDTLTVTIARPHDHWLHARGVHGAHVIIPRDKNAQIPPELLLDAAHLAAHFSDARGERLTEIQHTEKRYLRKPKGAAPGAVLVDREKVLVLRLEPDRITRLLASEER
jgi:predicted ribosome quality control (RQC) complex YloA/Tae2 family protein